MPHTDLVGMEIFLNWQTLLFSLGIFVLTYFLRLTVQFFWRTWRASRLYNDFVLHVLPIVLGGAVALFAKKFPWPDALVPSASARLFYGIFLGMTCGLVYGRVRAALTGSNNKTLEPTDVVPPEV
jgi:cytochrome c biogenesis protein CcdA